MPKGFFSVMFYFWFVIKSRAIEFYLIKLHRISPILTNTHHDNAVYPGRPCQLVFFLCVAFPKVLIKSYNGKSNGIKEAWGKYRVIAINAFSGVRDTKHFFVLILFSKFFCLVFLTVFPFSFFVSDSVSHSIDENVTKRMCFFRSVCVRFNRAMNFGANFSTSFFA